ncbi:hypothetical protein GCU56_22035 [Geodermatophilus sabuli]|uniref:DUF1023 domain-containing protein n=1 Tax=Geodermatophilus sabuli TaxID=1564158 RepID=A0A7K3W6T8_9ACTN|nr:alpha/beta hydrolase [Geodermatophilus sabuli]NEK60542.1 hypothetical protein [Geodermatophilus sabuli]
MSSATLPDIAGWDVPSLRAAVSVLTAVADRLPAWRARMEVVGRSLGHADCWYGPAATAAAAALQEVSTAATAVTAALTESLEQAAQLLVSADTAQELAEQALATAAAVPVELDGDGRVTGPLPESSGAGPDAGSTAAVLRAEALAGDAVYAAGSAALAASAAADALAPLGVASSLAPATFDDLSWLLAVSGPATPPPPPSADAGPDQVAAWWAALSTAARSSAIAGHPARIGALDGVPTWARDRANRLLLGRELADPARPGHAVAESVSTEIREREERGEDVQLHQFRPDEGLVALALGDLDEADAVAVLVPGVGTDAAYDLDAVADDAAAVAHATGAAAPELAVATVAWLGYRAPPLARALSTSAARSGGPALDRALDGLVAARSTDPPRTTVLAHSYGTVVSERAAQAPGVLAADSVVLLGSPGMDGDADALEAAEVYEASSRSDYVTWLEVHGEQTWDTGFGASALPTDDDMGHSDYYDPDRPTLPAMGEVVAGTWEPR